MNMQKKVFIICLMMNTSFYVHASDLLSVLSQAKQSDPTFRAAGFDKAAIEEGIVQARSRLLPTVSLAWEEKETDQEIKQAENDVYATGDTKFDTSTGSLSISLSVFNYEHWLRYDQSHISGERASVEFEKAKQDLLLRVSERYFEALKAREQLLAIAAEKDAMQRHFEYAKKSKDAGIGRSAEVFDAEARYLASIAKEIEYQRVFDDSRYALLEITGRLPENLLAIKKELPLVPVDNATVDEWIQQGLANNPDIRIQQKAVEEASYEVKAQGAGHYPNLSLQLNGYSQETGGSLFGGGSEVDTTEILLKLEVPIYQGGYVSSREREAVQRMYKAQEELHKASRSIKNQAQSSYQGVIANIAQIKALNKTVIAQQSVLANKEKGYKTGLYNIMTVLDAQQDLASAQQAYVAARNDYAINYIRLKRSAGVLTDGDIATVNSWLVPLSQ